VAHPAPRFADAVGAPGGPIVAAHRAACVVGPRRAPVTHEFAALGFYTAGRARFEQRGLWTVERGDVLLVPAGEAHRLVAADGAELWGLGFCAPCFAGDEVGRLIEPFERVRAGAAAVVRIPDDRHGYLETLFAELAAASAPERQATAAVVQRSLLTLILDEVGRAGRWSDPPRAGDVVAASLRAIERRCLGPLTLNEVAEAVGRSPSYVTTALTRATGRSAGAWIVAGRMAEARRRLLHSDERVDIIAERVGYADATHFIRMFRREHGATPAAWRAARVRSSG
jgi:AraC family transcriptional activator of pobA